VHELFEDHLVEVVEREKLYSLFFETGKMRLIKLKYQSTSGDFSSFIF